jgi:predicted phosphate transport protein (TIGR00153 family)
MYSAKCMKSIKSLLHDREHDVLQMIIEQATIVRGSIFLLDDLFEKLKSGDWGSAVEKSLEIAREEHRTDVKREEIATKIFREAYMPDFREAVLMLIEKIDEVMDSIKDTARIVAQRRFNEKIILDVLEPEFTAYVKLCVKAVETMYMSISKLTININEALKFINDIKSLEVQVDEVKILLVKRLYNIDEKTHSILTILQIKDIILFLDNIVDNAEDVGDILQLLYFTMRS